MIEKKTIDLEEYDQLSSQLIDLECELDLKSQHIAHLEGVLNDVLPLRRHFKRQIKTKISNVNNRIIQSLKSHRKYEPIVLEGEGIALVKIFEADKNNFIGYNRSSKKTLRLKFYLYLTGSFIRLSSKLLRISKV